MSPNSEFSNLNILSQVAVTLKTESSDIDYSDDVFTVGSQDIKDSSPLISSPISSPCVDETCFKSDDSRLVQSGESLELVNSLLSLKQQSRSYIYGPIPDIQNHSVPRYLDDSSTLSTGAKITKRKHSPKTGSQKIEKRHGQGRPFTNSINARFYLQESIEDLYCSLNNILEFRFADPTSGLLQIYRLAKPRQPGSQFQNMHFNNSPSTANLFEKLCAAFEISCFKFVRIVRNIDGKIVKIETVDHPTDPITPEWIKQNVCKPRYKSNMKIHLVRSNQPTRECIYKDMKMYEDDIENIYNCQVKIVEL